MRGLVFITLSLCLATGVQAQTYERKDFTFKSEKIKNAEGEVSEVKVGAYVGKKLIKEMTYEIEPALSSDLAEYVGTISETDLNFDGYPDVEIIPVDCSHNQGVHCVSIEDALKWNYNVTDEEVLQLFTCLKEELDGDQIEAGSVLAAAGDVLSIKTGDEKNIALAHQIDEKIQEVLKAFKLR